MVPAQNIDAASGSHKAPARAGTDPLPAHIKEAPGPGVASGAHGELAIRPHHLVPAAEQAVSITRTSLATEETKPPYSRLPPELWTAIVEYLDLPSLHSLDLVSRYMQHKARNLIPARRFDLELRLAGTPRHLSFLLRGDVPHAYKNLGEPARQRRVGDVLRVTMATPSVRRGAMLTVTHTAMTEDLTGLRPRELVLRAATLVRRSEDVRALLRLEQAPVSSWEVEEVAQLFTLLVGRAAVIDTRAGQSLMGLLARLHLAVSPHVALPALEVFVAARPADGLLPPSSTELLREFALRRGEARVWPSPRELLERDQLYGDTRNAAHFAYWLARVGPAQLPEVLQMPADERLPILERYHVDRVDALPEQMEALLQTVAEGTRPLHNAVEVREVLRSAEARRSDWPTWVEDRQQLLHLLGSHLAKMPPHENALGMAILREDNEALPEGRRIDVEVYAN
jgi:hypothetical protein